MTDELAFAIADRWPGADPASVEDWDETLVDRAVQRISAEATYERMARSRQRAAGG